VPQIRIGNGSNMSWLTDADGSREPIPNKQTHNDCRYVSAGLEVTSLMLGCGGHWRFVLEASGGLESMECI